jgi:pyruvate/2-oxoglutarate dehydrogenase complex dihydrolipoamide acyltransferase (E2) component
VAAQRKRAVSEERTQPNTDAEETLARRRQDNGGRRPDQEEPDVLLDVPNLEVEKITLEVDSLRAHISVLAELANLLNLSVGADVRLDQVKLEIDGVRAQALLKVRLENVRAILEKALDTIAENPQILEGLARTVDRTAEQVGGAAREAVGEGGAVGLVAGGVGDTTRQVGQVAERVGEGAQNAVGQVADQAGQAAQGVTEEARGEVNATPSAERLAQELGVDLSQVGGTGAGGYITVKDVRSAARGG